MRDDNDRQRSDEMELVTFLLGPEQYGLDIMSVREIIRMPELTRAPQSPDFVAGMLNLRGEVLPVIDLRRRMKLAPVERDKRTRVVIVAREGGNVGLVVDAVADVLRLKGGDIQLPPAVARGEDTSLVSGVAMLPTDRLLLVMDLDALLPDMGGDGEEAAEGEAGAMATVIPLNPTGDAPRRSLRRAA